MQLDMMQIIPILLVFSLIFAVVVMAVTGWPKMKPKERFRTFFYLSLLGLFGAAYRTVREEIDETLNRIPIIVLQKSARNSLAVAMAAIVSFIQITWLGELSNNLLFLSGWLILIVILVTHNISTIYYVQKLHSDK
ncbi:MAG: hypothetical protein ACXABZ_13175 [Candidatus Thorarchaeota archaeon]